MDSIPGRKGAEEQRKLWKHVLPRYSEFAWLPKDLADTFCLPALGCGLQCHHPHPPLAPNTRPLLFSAAIKLCKFVLCSDRTMTNSEAEHFYLQAIWPLLVNPDEHLLATVVIRETEQGLLHGISAQRVFFISIEFVHLVQHWLHIGGNVLGPGFSDFFTMQYGSVMRLGCTLMIICGFKIDRFFLWLYFWLWLVKRWAFQLVGGKRNWLHLSIGLDGLFISWRDTLTFHKTNLIN